ncbi:MAG: DUF6795 domain-containing protein [Psychromonas sp.]
MMVLIKHVLLAKIILVLLLISSDFASAGVFGFFDRETFLLSPPIQGQVVVSGKAVIGKTIYRELYYDGRHLDHTVTDKQGDFTFPASTIRTSIPSSMFGNGSLMQHIYVGEPGVDEFTLWLSKLFYNGNQDSLTLKQKLIGLRCDIDKQAHTYDISVQENPEQQIVIHTLCDVH